MTKKAEARFKKRFPVHYRQYKMQQVRRRRNRALARSTEYDRKHAIVQALRAKEQRKAAAKAFYGVKHNPEGGSILTWLLVGVGAYLLYNWWTSQQVAPATTTPALPVGTTAVTSLTTTPINTATGTTTTVSTAAPLIASLSSPLGVALTAQLTTYMQSTNNPVNQNYSGYQWDYLAARSLGSSYINLAQLPSIVGASSYSMSQYMQALLNQLYQNMSTLPVNTGIAGHAPLVPNIAGLGCTGCQSTQCQSCSLGVGAVSATELMYRKMANRKGWAVGDFAGTKANATEGNWVN